MIVPFYNVEAYLEECLQSIADQTMGDFEVLVVDDGSPDGSRAIAERYAAQDPRFRLITRPNGGLGAARNTGIREARGRYLTFVDSDDIVPPDALGALLASARRTGSQVVMGAVERFHSLEAWRPPWVNELYPVARLGITLEGNLDLLRNLYTWNKLYLRDFWTEQDLWFREGVSYEDQPLVTQILLAAASIDVIPDLVYRWRSRDDASSISQQVGSIKDLRDRISAWQDTQRVLDDAPEEVRLAWLRTLFDPHLIWYLRRAAVADDEYWSLLHPVLVDLTDRAPAEVWATAPPWNRVAIEMARQDRRHELFEFVDQGGLTDPWDATSEPRPDGILLHLPGFGARDLDDDLFLMRTEQLRVTHAIENLHWDERGLVLRGWAYLRNVDLSHYDIAVDVVVRDPDGAAGSVIAARTGVEVVTPPPYEDAQCDYRPGSFEAVVPYADLTGLGTVDAGGSRRTLWLRVGSAGLVAESEVSRMLRLGSPGRLQGTTLPDGTRMDVEWNFGGHVSVVHRAPAKPDGTTGRRRVGPVEITEVEVLDSGRVRLTGTTSVPGAETVRVSLVSVRRAAVTAEVPVHEGGFAAECELVAEQYRFGVLPLDIGEYRVSATVTGAGTEPAEFRGEIGSELNARLPIGLRTPTCAGMFVRGPGGGLQLNIVRPLGEMRSRFAQVARQHQPGAERATTRGVLFRSYFGEKATDNGVAIQEELRRRGSDLPVYWAVQDHSVPVPGDGIPVVVNSAEWFDLLGSVTYYVDNMYQPIYHHRPEGQVIVQTFHGYPFKQMGRPHWVHQGFQQAKIDAYARRSAEWDYLVSPAPYATPLLTRDFGYDGQVLEIGYPRNDVLLSAEAPALREQVRASLGIRPDQTVVLYAPTFRDYLAKDDNVAVMSDFLDLGAVSRALGDDGVVLMRGHAFHARTDQRVGSDGRVIDVTDYPEVSDLYLASDVGVVDYSSLRFDFGVTGKPMIFLVPDIDRYVKTRGWLFDLTPSAPGPQVATTAEVIDQLRDVPGLVARHAEAYAAFRRDFIPLEDGHAAARFIDAVMVPRGDAPATGATG